MRTRPITAIALALSFVLIAACGSDESSDEIQIQYGTYVRVADPSFESIEECEAQKEEEGDGILFNCAQRLRINDDGTFFRVLTDIAENGTYVIEDSSLVLTPDGLEATSEVPINDDGTLADRWQLDAGADSDE